MLTNNQTNTSIDFTVKQTAQILQVSAHSVYELLNTGKLESYKVSQRGTRISQDQLERFRLSGGI